MRLKWVQVQQHQQQVGIGPRAGVTRRLEAAQAQAQVVVQAQLEVAAVAQAGQGVGQAQFAQLGGALVHHAFQLGLAQAQRARAPAHPGPDGQQPGQQAADARRIRLPPGRLQRDGQLQLLGAPQRMVGRGAHLQRVMAGLERPEAGVAAAGVDAGPVCVQALHAEFIAQPRWGRHSPGPRTRGQAALAGRQGQALGRARQLPGLAVDAQAADDQGRAGALGAVGVGQHAQQAAAAAEQQAAAGQLGAGQRTRSCRSWRPRRCRSCRGGRPPGRRHRAGSRCGPVRPRADCRRTRPPCRGAR